MSRLIPYGTAAERAAAAESVGAHLRGGGVVAYPTETVYGLGCALDPRALATLAAFKGDRPFLLLIAGPEQAPALAWTEDARRLAARFWPGPLTLALDDPGGRYPPQVRGPDGAVAVRVSPHPAIPALLAAAGGPVTSTSANRPGEAPSDRAADAAGAAASIPGLLVLDGGALPASRPSTIVRCGGTVRLLREGAVTRNDLERVVELE